MIKYSYQTKPRKKFKWTKLFWFHGTWLLNGLISQPTSTSNYSICQSLSWKKTNNPCNNKTSLKLSNAVVWSGITRSERAAIRTVETSMSPSTVLQLICAAYISLILFEGWLSGFPLFILCLFLPLAYLFRHVFASR